MHRASDISELKCWDTTRPMLHVANVKKALRLAWKRAFGDECQSCQRRMHFEIKFRLHPRFATIDHIIARALGGADALDNIQVICRDCNNLKSVDEFRSKDDS